MKKTPIYTMITKENLIDELLSVKGDIKAFNVCVDEPICDTCGCGGGWTFYTVTNFSINNKTVNFWGKNEI